MRNCNEGTASRIPPNPTAADAAMDARPAAIPAMSGTDRRNPKFAPDAVASMVAPPGLTVETRAKRKRGISDPKYMALLGAEHVNARTAPTKTNIEVV